jgi:predicted ferric reductase
VFAVLAFITATQHGCYHLSERLESLEPILESSRHVTGIASLSIVGLMLLTAHEIVRANQYSWFRTLHLTLFLSLTISATLHNASFLTLNFVGIAAWLGSRVLRKLQATSKVVSIQSTGRITHVTLEHSLKDITAGQFGYLGVRGPGFTKYGWARPFSFSGIHSHLEEDVPSSSTEEEKEPREAKTTISRLHLQQDTHHRPGFHHESSSVRVPDERALGIEESSGGDQPASKADHPSNLVDLHIHSRGTFTTALLKAASQQDLESKTPNQVRMELDGPYGTPWLSSAKHYYTDFELALFVCSGVGITPWLAVMQHIATQSRSSRTRDVHIIWSIHEQGICQHVHLRQKMCGLLTPCHRYL